MGPRSWQGGGAIDRVPAFPGRRRGPPLSPRVREEVDPAMAWKEGRLAIFRYGCGDPREEEGITAFTFDRGGDRSSETYLP